MAVAAAEVQDNEALLEEMLRETEEAPEPGTLHVKDILSRGDDDLPVPVIARAMKTAGYVWLYSTATGDRSLCNRNMLPSKLKQKREDGQPAWSTRRPKVAPFRGTLRCLLHPERRTAEMDAMGLPVCNKANLPNEHQVRLHMQHRHRDEWAAIEEQRKEQERQEEMAFRRTVLAGAGEKAGHRRKEDDG